MRANRKLRAFLSKVYRRPFNQGNIQHSRLKKLFVPLAKSSRGVAACCSDAGGGGVRFSHAMVYPCTIPLVCLLKACNGCLLAFLREMRGSRGEHEPSDDEMLRASRVLRVQRLLALHDDNSSDSSSVLATSDVELLMVSNARAGSSPSPSEDLADEVNDAGVTTQRQRLRGDTAIREARERMGNIYKGA